MTPQEQITNMTKAGTDILTGGLSFDLGTAMTILISIFFLMVAVDKIKEVLAMAVSSRLTHKGYEYLADSQDQDKDQLQRDVAKRKYHRTVNRLGGM